MEDTDKKEQKTAPKAENKPRVFKGTIVTSITSLLPHGKAMPTFELEGDIMPKNKETICVKYRDTSITGVAYATKNRRIFCINR